MAGQFVIENSLVDRLAKTLILREGKRSYLYVLEALYVPIPSKKVYVELI